MFNLGYKEIVLNDLNGVTLDETGFKIEGYGNLLASGTSKFVAERAQPRLPEITEWYVGEGPPAGSGFGMRIDATIHIEPTRRRSNLATDFIEDKRTIVIPHTIIGTGENVGEALVKTWELMWDKYPTTEPPLKISSSGAAIKLVFSQENTEMTITRIEVYIEIFTVATGETVDTLSGDITLVSREFGTAGVGQGSFIEESRRMATPENTMPYNVQHGGNSQSIDVHGSYTTWLIECTEDSEASGWGSHEYIKHSYVQAKMTSKPRNYVIYINEKVSPGLDTGHQDFIANVAGTVETVLGDGSVGAVDGSDFFALAAMGPITGVNEEPGEVIFTWDELPGAIVYKVVITGSDIPAENGTFVKADLRYKAYSAATSITATISGIGAAGEESATSTATVAPV